MIKEKFYEQHADFIVNKRKNKKKNRCRAFKAQNLWQLIVSAIVVGSFNSMMNFILCTSRLANCIPNPNQWNEDEHKSIKRQLKVCKQWALNNICGFSMGIRNPYPLNFTNSISAFIVGHWISDPFAVTYWNGKHYSLIHWPHWYAYSSIIIIIIYHDWLDL